MLKAINITKTYNSGKKVALNNFNIEVPKGSIYGLLGPNGSGKTSFIRIINQIIKPDSGEVFINNQKLNPKHIKEIGYMPEERGLYKNMTIGEQLTYFGELKGISKNDATTQAKYWFEQLKIDQWWGKRLSELSKGMAQKIQFIVTVIHQPKLLILDEPFSGFDPINANLIKDKIIELKKKGITIILSTHRMESVEEMCDYIVLINQSNKLLDGKIFDIREHFKQNIFNVVLTNIKSEHFEHFKSKYKLDNFVNKNGLISFQIRHKNNNVLLEELLQIGEIRVFEEKIPSMNEIFINTINK